MKHAPLSLPEQEKQSLTETMFITRTILKPDLKTLMQLRQLGSVKYRIPGNTPNN